MLSVRPLPVENLGNNCENSRAGENVSGFHWSALEFSQTFTLVFTSYEGMENMFCS